MNQLLSNNPLIYKVKGSCEYDDLILSWIHSQPRTGYGSNISSFNHDGNGNRFPSAIIEALKDIWSPIIINFCEEKLSYGPTVTKDHILWPGDPWYQVYEKDSMFTWHAHDCQFAIVQYFELPPGAGTEFWFNEEVLKLDIEEGDVVIFPSWLLHRSAPNLSTDTKTIIATNFSIITDSAVVKHIHSKINVEK